MHPVHISNLDLNLLRAFDAVFEEGGVTRAGARLGLTQSAVSHALNRLRYILGDELFVRGPRGMQPTPRALAIGPQVHLALEQLMTALAVADFDPAVSERQFTLAAAAYACTVFVPPLVAQVSNEAPNVGLRVVEMPVDLAERLDSGGVDFAIGAFESAPQRFVLEPLLSETMVWVIRAHHPLANRMRTLEDLIAVPHVAVADGFGAGGARAQDVIIRRSTSKDANAVDVALAALGLRRRVGVTVADTASATAVVARSDMAALIPRRLALLAAESGRLRLIDLAYEPPAVDVQLVYRRDRLSDPATAWMHERLAALAGFDRTRG
jgi:DNA-binding transcriptional LysR family regulator